MPGKWLKMGILGGQGGQKGSEMDDHIIRLTNKGTFRETDWEMYVNLVEVASCAGQRVKDLYNGGTMTAYSMKTAKKLLRQILEFGTEEDFEKCNRYLATNEKLYSYWKELTA